MNYEFDGKKYEKASTHQKEWGNKLISELNLTGNEKILDLGCGDGKLTADLANLVPNGFVLGIDASKGMIEVAKGKETENLKFQLIDINNLTLSDKFDIIFSNATLHWIKNHKKLWGDVIDLLSACGIVRCNFAGNGTCLHFFKIIKQTMALEEYQSYFVNFEWPWYMPDIDEYKKIVEQFPFSEIKVWGENADRFFQNKEAIIGWINQPSIVPFLKYIEENKKEEFRNYVIEQMLKVTIQNDGRYFETFKRINVFCKK
jgi:trans-aconitate methyltransferase